jgi:putative DNA primase/helicase
MKQPDLNETQQKEGGDAVRAAFDGAERFVPDQTETAAEGHNLNIAPEFTEEGIALAFAKKHKNRLRYVDAWKSWMNWDGLRWCREKTLLTYDLVRKECREAAARVDEDKKGLRTLLNTARVRSSVEVLCRSDRRFAATTEQWDSDDWLINTEGGIVDLRTGKNVGRDPGRYMTKISGARPAGNCPLWRKFLAEVTGNDEELQAYLKRVCGYFLTGSIREHALFFVYGKGGNGKGLFLNTVADVLGNYHVVSAAETFAERKAEQHPTELARLNGARLVISQETKEGQYWNETRIKKSLTGGDVIPARFMRGDWFEFEPKFKLCIVGNSKPQLRNVDDAIRRRFNLIPFAVNIAE